MPSLRFIDRIRAALKAFVLGPAVVQPFAEAWGIDPSTFSPPEYLEYIAKSVGVYACINLRARCLSGLPVCLYKGEGEDQEKVTQGRLYDLLKKVNPHWTWPHLLEMTEYDLCLEGRAFWFLERGKSGKGPPREIWRGRPDKVLVVPHPENYIAGYIYEDERYRLAFSPDEVIYFRYPNPVDEFSGLSPLAAARVSADLGMQGLKANTKLFSQGMQIGGIISPQDPNAQWDKDKVDELSALLRRRLAGEDNAHKWVVLGRQINAQPMGINARDAQFIEQMRWSLADICRVYQVPPVLVQDYERAILDNFDTAHKTLWTLCLIPEKQQIEGWLNEQLLPMFPGEADSIELETDGVAVLQEDADAEEKREAAQIADGRITINEWRKGRGLDPVAWGDGWWHQATLTQEGESGQALASGQPPAALAPPIDVAATPVAAMNQALGLLESFKAKQIEAQNKMAYGSEEHQVYWRAFDSKARRFEKEFGAFTRRLMERQQNEILRALWSPAGRSVKDVSGVVRQPFDRALWIAEFAMASEALYRLMVGDAGSSVLGELAGSLSFDLQNPLVSEFIAGRAQRFAEQVNETTWQQLKDSLVQGEATGEGIDQLGDRVRAIMGDRIRSSEEVIARTEVIGGLNGGALLGAIQSGVVNAKRWIAALDDRTRDSHIKAHGQVAALMDNFDLAGGSGPAPGQIGVAEEDIQCRCSLAFLEDKRFPAVQKPQDPRVVSVKNRIAAGIPDREMEYDKSPASYRAETLAVQQRVYADAPPGEAPTDVALRQPPIKLEYDEAAKQLSLVDGRHRLLAAELAGAEAIMASLRYFRPDASGDYQEIDAALLKMGLAPTPTELVELRARAEAIYAEQGVVPPTGRGLSALVLEIGQSLALVAGGNGKHS